MMDHESQIDDTSVPAALHRELRKLRGPIPPITPELDASILGNARADFARRLWFRRTLMWSAGIAASAASIMLAIHLVKVTAPSPVPTARSIPGDIDHNGKIDILDAYLLARQLDAHRPTPADADFTRDGRIDSADVEAIAAAAVRLPQGAVQ